MNIEELKIEVTGDYKEPKGSDEFTKLMERISKETGKFELVGVALNKYYGVPVFDIENKTYILKDYEYQENKVILILYKPEDFEYWESLNQFMCSEYDF